MSAARDSGLAAALPLAATAALLTARLLPVHFEYRENALGIVSLASLARYPQQQETFWLLASVTVAVLVTWGASRWLTRRAVGPRVAVEAFAVGSLLALLWLPGPAGPAVAAALAAGALFLGGSGSKLSTATGLDPVALSPGRVALLSCAAVLLAIALTSDFQANLWSVLNRFPDASRVFGGFPFMGEIGQHLAWANALMEGGFHGKDFFCLYGPLYDFGLLGAWQVFGRSVVAWDFYFSATRVLALAGLLVLTALLVRRRLLVLAVPFLLPWINLRSGLAFIGLCFLLGWLISRRGSLVALAGLTAGVSLLFSQEFGLAFCVVAALVFALHAAWRPALVFAAAGAALIVPVFSWYAANDALLPMLREMLGYPAYIFAGYAKLPFPALASAIPFSISDWGGRELLAFQLGYGVPAVCLGGLLWALPISRLDPRAPLASVRGVVEGLRSDPVRTGVLAVAVFGMLAFRTALGRSDLKHMIDTMPAAVVLLVVAADRGLSFWRSGTWPAGLAAWRAAAFALLIATLGFSLPAEPLKNLDHNLNLLSVWRNGRRAVGDPRVMQVVQWVTRHTEDGEPVLFLPNNGAYYYLTDRPNPIRFAMGHQIVTQAHRDEVLAQLQARPPRYLVWDAGALRVDGLPDELVFGKPLLRWLEESYEEEQRYGDVSISGFRTAGGAEQSRSD
ncbi:MAG: hypothetical protein QF890_13610 [Myxococcota bacterium]|nr:hypothetical protein [Deltaproteobacteria bacterium]MCP4240985.1 hypothetical protein [bacterium]MDP6075773.1 hypothetical protein [Myxococcota bacterium]MBT40619.1 hypothetical protein [Deltaproteobacteria bacterium]MDP6242628.1 hypothetical protein [Myxococcota bacterium]